MTRARAKHTPDKAPSPLQARGVENIRATAKKCGEVLDFFKGSLESAGFAQGAFDYQRMSELLATQRLWSEREAPGLLDEDFRALADKAAAVYALLKPYATAMARLATLSAQVPKEAEPAPVVPASVARPVPAPVPAAVSARKRKPRRKPATLAATPPEPSPEARLLGEVSARPRGVSLTLLQSRLGLSKSAFEELLAGLEARQLVRRSSSSGRTLITIASANLPARPSEIKAPRRPTLRSSR